MITTARYFYSEWQRLQVDFLRISTEFCSGNYKTFTPTDEWFHNITLHLWLSRVGIYDDIMIMENTKDK